MKRSLQAPYYQALAGLPLVYLGLMYNITCARAVSAQEHRPAAGQRHAILPRRS